MRGEGAGERKKGSRAGGGSAEKRRSARLATGRDAFVSRWQMATASPDARLAEEAQQARRDAVYVLVGAEMVPQPRPNAMPCGWVVVLTMEEGHDVPCCLPLSSGR